MEAKFLSQTRSPFPCQHRPRHARKLNQAPVLAILTKPLDNISVVTDKNGWKLEDNITGQTTKTVYNDNWFEKLAINHLSKSVQAATGLRNSNTGYESLVQAAIDASRKFSLVQQRELVIQALDRAIPRQALCLVKLLPKTKFAREYFAVFTTLFFTWLVGACEVRESELNGRKEKNVVHIKKCRFLEETNCVGMCTNLCKVPTQIFIKDSLGMPMTMVPDFDDMSCKMVFGQDPPALTEDPAFNQPCYKLCKTNQKHIMKCSS